MGWQASFEQLEQEFAEIERQLSDPVVISDANRLRELSVRHSQLQPALELYHEYQKTMAEVEDAELLLTEADDDDMRQFLETEKAEAEARIDELREQLIVALLPPDPADNKNAIVEIRAGTGGDEAALFAGDLFDMYNYLAQRRGWKVESLSQNPSEMGGFKEIIFAVEGAGVYGVLKHESGVHRVQRVPATESQGRLHTSAATVAVLPEAKEIDVKLDNNDLKVEVFRAGGPGGQHMQKNETAVRVTHLPTDISVTCSDQRSQHQNRERALRLLRARLYEREQQRQQQQIAAERRQQVRSGDRSEKIRTYNFPQDRLTDHRIGLTLHNLPALMSGELDELIEELRQQELQQRLEELGTS